MITGRSMWFGAILLTGATQGLRGQAICHQPSALCADSRRQTADGIRLQPLSWRRTAPHYGKWLTAAGTVALTLLGAQASLLATTALFIIDLHPGAGPENIPFAPMRVGVRIAF